MSNAITHQFRVLQSVVSSTLEAWRGTSVVLQALQPAHDLQLFDMEGSPYHPKAGGKRDELLEPGPRAGALPGRSEHRREDVRVA